jgi:hypothetical protein
MGSLLHLAVHIKRRREMNMEGAVSISLVAQQRVPATAGGRVAAMLRLGRNSRKGVDRPEAGASPAAFHHYARGRE